jgi:hypothetical protein
MGMSESATHQAEKPALRTVGMKSRFGTTRMMTINQCQIEKLPMCYCSLVVLAFTGQFEKDKIAPMMTMPSQGMIARSESAPLNPAREHIRHSGTMTRAAKMIVKINSMKNNAIFLSG